MRKSSSSRSVKSPISSRSPATLENSNVALHEVRQGELSLTHLQDHLTAISHLKCSHGVLQDSSNKVSAYSTRYLRHHNLQGDMAWLKRLPHGHFQTINPRTSDVFEMVSLFYSLTFYAFLCNFGSI